jgi:hypothetical protein
VNRRSDASPHRIDRDLEEDTMEGEIQQLPNGRFIIASWVACAGEWYATQYAQPEKHTASTLERLAAKGVPTYATREEAEDDLALGLL